MFVCLHLAIYPEPIDLILRFFYVHNTWTKIEHLHTLAWLKDSVCAVIYLFLTRLWLSNLDMISFLNMWLSVFTAAERG